jgi:hypothetical protein
MLLCVAAGVAASLARWPDVFVQGEVYFLDPDCYSRMTRVGLLLAGQGPSLRHHTFENAPEGTAPHTTAPLDWLIAGATVLTGQPGVSAVRDRIGAFVSPALGVVFLSVLTGWAWRRRFGLAGLALAAFSPILAHSFSIGRPDHQSLLLVVVLPALMLELEGWTTGRHRPLAAGVLWGMACWISMFEPLILLLLCLCLRVVVHGWSVLPRSACGWKGVLAFLAVVVCAVVVDGWRVQVWDPETRGLFARWAGSIGELRPVGPSGVFAWVGWMVPFLPLPLLFRGREGVARALLLGVLVALTLGLGRWGPFCVLVAALVVPWALAGWERPMLAGSLFALSLWPVTAHWDASLFPDAQRLALREEGRVEGVLLRRMAARIAEEPGIFVSSWWLAPALAYWSGAEGVAGSSHQSLPGIAATARFFLADDPDEAHRILASRRAEWVLADDPERTLTTSADLLGSSTPAQPMATRLFGPRPIPGLTKVASNAFFRLYRVDPLRRRENQP